MSPKSTVCTKCGAPIFWARMSDRDGKNWPINVDPDPTHGWVILTVNDRTGTIKGQSLNRDERVAYRSLPNIVRRTPHFQTCDAPEEREKRRKWQAEHVKPRGKRYAGGQHA